MSKARPWAEVSAPPSTVALDVSTCCVPITSKGSPIDGFLDATAHILQLGQPADLAESAALGRLLVLGLVTAVESYVRDLLFGVISTCPISRRDVEDQLVALGALNHYGPSELARGIFEGSSFASESEIRKRTKQVCGVSWSESDSVGVALANFEKVCHMRHAAVHAQGILNRGNARALGVEGSGRQLHIVVDLNHLHAVAHACISFVRAYNQRLYDGLLQRWLTFKLLSGTWADDKSYFARLYVLFRSDSDAVSPRTAYTAYRALRPVILQRLVES